MAVVALHEGTDRGVLGHVSGVRVAQELWGVVVLVQNVDQKTALGLGTALHKHVLYIITKIIGGS